MSLGDMIPGSKLDPDWRAVVVGATVVGVLCAVPVLEGWIKMPSDFGSMEADQGEGPGFATTAMPFLIAVPGPFVAGFLARSTNLRGAVEGMLSVPIGAVLPVLVAFVDQFLALGSLALAWKIELLWRGVGFYAVATVPFIPFACILGGALGWLGKFVRDAAGTGVTVAWS